MTLRTVAVCALAALTAAAPGAARAAGIKLVAVVAASGVQVPDEKPLRAYASRPWPRWNLPPAALTAHGAQLATALGVSYRAYYAHAGLFDASGCNVDAYAYASALPAARASAQVLLAGFAPGCTAVVDGAGAEPDAIFPPIAATAFASPAPLAPEDAAALRDLDALLDCASNACRRVASPQNLGVAADAVTALRSEYDDGLPGAHAGWGHLDLSLLRELTRLPVLRYQLENRDASAARATASGLAVQLLDTLQQAASGKRSQTAHVPQRARFALFVANAGYVAALGTLLGASWTLPESPTDDVPPGGALVFELHEPDRRGGEAFVRTSFVAQPDDAMRRAGASPVVPVSRVPVRIAGCPSADCPLHVFAAVARGSAG